MFSSHIRYKSCGRPLNKLTEIHIDLSLSKTVILWKKFPRTASGKNVHFHKNLAHRYLHATHIFDLANQRIGARFNALAYALEHVLTTEKHMKASFINVAQI